MRRRPVVLGLSLAVFAAGIFGPVSCASHGAASKTTMTPTGLPAYPNATVIGATSDALAIYRSSDSYRAVADWYAAHMPAGTQSSRNDALSQATYAVFSPTDTRTAHVEVSDGTVRITLTDVKSGPAPATGR
ncbi:MAG TPA: hypothetical protein VJN22_03405 [Candidatus Eremiobacteraceae bacterium]|nr:hypothetical protein [Candidatus Eremiobacteraceae bacterium]